MSWLYVGVFLGIQCVCLNSYFTYRADSPQTSSLANTGLCVWHLRPIPSPHVHHLSHQLQTCLTPHACLPQYHQGLLWVVHAHLILVSGLLVPLLNTIGVRVLFARCTAPISGATQFTTFPIGFPRLPMSSLTGISLPPSWYPHSLPQDSNLFPYFPIPVPTFPAPSQQFLPLLAILPTCKDEHRSYLPF